MSITDVTFNTGRRYTKEGQVIRTRFLPDLETVVFADFSRMIYGEFPLSSINTFRTPGGLAAKVMEFYDRGGYQPSATWLGRLEGEKIHNLQL